MIHQESQPTNRDDQELHSKRVMIPIICRLELKVDQVHGGIRTSDVDNLKDMYDSVKQITDECEYCSVVNKMK